MRAKLAKASQVTQEVHDGRRVPAKATPPPGWMTARRRARYDRDLTVTFEPVGVIEGIGPIIRCLKCRALLTDTPEDRRRHSASHTLSAIGLG